MDPVILNRDQHQISRKNIDSNALKVLYRLHHMGFQSYLVGGGVRDLLLGKQPKDFDIGTNARPGQIKKLFRNCFLIGRRFRLAHIKFGPQIIEVSTFRKNLPTVQDDGTVHMLRRDNVYGSPAEDAFRRDFTVNGLFYNIADFKVIDYVSGLQDLDLKLIRTIGNSEIRFQEDPVRMIRAIRIAARLDFTIQEETLAAIQKHKAIILKCPSTRNLEELLTLVRYNAAEPSVKLLHSLGFTELLTPELHQFLLQLDEEHLNQDEYFWKYLRAFDHLDIDRHMVTPPVLLGVLLLPLYKYKFRDVSARTLRNESRIEDEIQKMIEPYVKRLCFPKRQRDRLSHMLIAQPHYSDVKRIRFRSGAFRRKSYFQEGFILFKLGAETPEATEVIKEWERRGVVLEPNSHNNQESNPHVNRRRRPHFRRKSRNHLNNSPSYPKEAT